MKSFAEFIFFEGVLERLIKLLPVQLVNLKEKVFYFLVILFFHWSVFEDRQKLHLCHRIKGVNGVLSG